MRGDRRRLAAVLVLGMLFLWAAMAQGPGGPPPGGQGGAGRGEGQGMRPKPPLETALDANGDGVIDAGEIANASAALKTLDKNGDGKLTPDEFRPPRPEGRGGPQGQQGGSQTR